MNDIRAATTEQLNEWARELRKAEHNGFQVRADLTNIQDRLEKIYRELNRRAGR